MHNNSFCRCIIQREQKGIFNFDSALPRSVSLAKRKHRVRANKLTESVSCRLDHGKNL